MGNGGVCYDPKINKEVFKRSFRNIIVKKAFDLRNYKKRRVCLIDVDSSIPNLALMKISSFFKKNKWKVDLIILNNSAYEHHKRKELLLGGDQYDKIFISTIFTTNRDVVIVKNCEEVSRGGTGHDEFKSRKGLPKEIEHMFPDYSLYPNNEYSIGYLTRGCIRNCKFCFIPQKEGKLKLNCSLKEFYNPKLPKIMLLDNNFLALPPAKCVQLLNELKKTGKRITFKQGLDFRLLTKEKAKLLSELDYDGEYIFAFDNPMDMPIIKKNLKIWRPLVKDWQTKFYVLVGFDTSLKQDMERVYFLKKNKCLPYIMRHTNCYTSPLKAFYTDLASWCNQPGLFKNMSFKEFICKRHVTEEREMETRNIINENMLKIR